MRYLYSKNSTAVINSSGLYYKHVMIVNDNSSVVIEVKIQAY